MPLRDPDESTLGGAPTRDEGGAAAARAPVLELVWSSEEPSRVGEVYCLPRGALHVPFTIGRAVEAGDEGDLPLVLCQLRPFERVDTGPLRDARVSRRHLRVSLLDGGLSVERLGSGELRIDGHPIDRAIADPGAILEAVGRFALRVATRPAAWPNGGAWGAALRGAFAFGEADPDGIVGESPAAWALRRQIAAIGPRREHVLVHGPTGVGKELVVRALHAASARAKQPLISRSAATIPDAWIDAELFGNVHDYPTPGAPERVGLCGEADGGALYLDELGELAHPLQARLMRVMDHGEYQRLGEDRRRASDLRLYGATNRPPEALKHDLLTRFIHRIAVPGLEERRGDVPLLARHLLRRIGDEHPELRARFFTAGGEPRIAAGWMASLLYRDYGGHLRELRAALWDALTQGEGPTIGPSIAEPRPAPRALAPHTQPESLTREEIVAALDACDGVRERAWRVLRLQSRHQLKRLLKKFEIG
ncbi:MAG: sigma 54-interacting transcriptional regulator [Nannocystaceae bacterium]